MVNPISEALIQAVSLRTFNTNGVKSASYILPSPFCLPCSAIGLHDESLSTVQVMAVTLANDAQRTHPTLIVCFLKTWCALCLCMHPS